MSEPIYVCGHAPAELDRLRTQGALFEDFTRRMFAAAGLQPGRRVLDIGCGVGDVSFLAADVVGSAGSVVGVDCAPEAIAAARARAQAESRPNVEFRLSAIDQIVDDRAFDALVGRFVLMHQADPAAILRSAARHVRPGGIVVILESALTAWVPGLHSAPHSPTYDEIARLITTIIRASGAEAGMGFRLSDVFERAGLPRPTMRLEACVEGGPDASVYVYVTESLRSLLPRADQLGVNGLADLNFEQLEGKLRAEAVALGGVLVSPPVVAAWSCKAEV